MAWWQKHTTLLDPEDTLPGRDGQMVVPARHHVNGNPLTPPWPEGYQTAVFALGFVANLVSAAVRLGAVGQTDGQRVTAALVPAVRNLAAEAADLTLEDLGGAAFRSDLAALRHETQYTRLFRS